MLKSMTGFGSAQATISSIGKVSVEIRSVNHKFLEVVTHLPEGMLSLEDTIKKLIEAQLKRGRVTCFVNIAQPQAGEVFVNQRLLKKYLGVLKTMQSRWKVKNSISLEMLIRLPGVLSLTENNLCAKRLWPRLRPLLAQALVGLSRARQKEGRALYFYLNDRAGELKTGLAFIKKRFHKAIADKSAGIINEEERSRFLKEADITEEIDRLAFHARNFKDKLKHSGPAGKELDFIAQEMQREANTMGAKSCDAMISAGVIRLKSEVEKLREQVQNIE